MAVELEIMQQARMTFAKSPPCRGGRSGIQRELKGKPNVFQIWACHTAFTPSPGPS